MPKFRTIKKAITKKISNSTLIMYFSYQSVKVVSDAAYCVTVVTGTEFMTEIK